MRLAVKRVYEEAAPADGKRVLVDRVWPRGLRKEDAAVDVWLKDIAPSTALRKWFGHDPARWEEFQARYGSELDANAEATGTLLELARHGPVTLLFSARDTEHNNARALRSYLERHARQRH